MVDEGLTNGRKAQVGVATIWVVWSGYQEGRRGGRPQGRRSLPQNRKRQTMSLVAGSMSTAQSETARSRPRSTARITAREDRERRIAYWVAQLPQASSQRIAGFAETSARSVQKWRL